MRPYRPLHTTQTVSQPRSIGARKRSATTTKGGAGTDAQRFGKDKDEDHSDEQLWLLRSRTDTGIADDADGGSGSEAAKANGHAGAEVRKANLGAVPSLPSTWDGAIYDDSDDEAVDTCSRRPDP